MTGSKVATEKRWEKRAAKVSFVLALTASIPRQQIRKTDIDLM